MERAQINLFQVIAGLIPLFWVLLALAVAIAGGELALLVIARRRRSLAGEVGLTDHQRRMAAWFAVAAAAGPIVLAVAVVASIHIGHVRFLAGLAASDPRQTVDQIVAGLEAFQNAKPWGLMVLIPNVVLGTIAAALHGAAASKSPPRPLLVTALMFVLVGLVPFLYGAFVYSAQLIKVLAGVAGVDPEMKRIMIVKGIEETRALLDAGAKGGAVGFAAALGVGVFVAVGSSRQGAAFRGNWWLPSLCLLVAIGLWVAAEPLRAEVALPWPDSPCAALTINRVATPPIDGPDAIPAAEVVTVAKDLLLFNGSPRDPEKVHDSLVVMRNNYELLHPGEPPDEDLVVVCAPDTPTQALVEVLRIAQATEYRRPAFAFGKQTTIERPTMGTQRRWQWTAAKALIPGVGPETPTPIVTVTVGDYSDCDGVARAVAAVRRSGKIAGLAF